MTKSDIKNQLIATIVHCRAIALSGDVSLFFKNFNDKWSIGENMMHLSKSAKSVNKALNLPKEQLIMFGVPSQPSGTYQDVVDRYLSVLATGVRATGGFVAQYTEGDTLADIIARFDEQHASLVSILESFADEELDKYQLPHPVLGNLTLREMYYFMDYHIQHHQKAIERIINVDTYISK
jgi:DinB superfamily